jgi:hypothetical protein
MITQFLSLKDSLPQIFDARQILRAVPAAAGAALISLLAENSFLNQLTESVQALSRLTLIASEGVLFFGSYFLLLILLREKTAVFLVSEIRKIPGR